MALVLPALTDCRWWFESLLVHSGVSSATRRKTTGADHKKWHPKMRHTSRTAKQRSFCKSLRDLVDDFCSLQRSELFMGKHVSRVACICVCVSFLTLDQGHPAGRRNEGGTDNKAAESLSRKGLSTKFPLMIVLMEYLAICERKRMRVQLEWQLIFFFVVGARCLSAGRT